MTEESAREAHRPGLPSNIEPLLALLRSAHRAQVSEGLEARILSRLQTQAGPAPSRSLRSWSQDFAWSYGWMPTAFAAASLVCVFSGAVVVAHESLLLTGSLETARKQSMPGAVVQPSLPPVAMTSRAMPPGAILVVAPTEKSRDGARGLAAAEARRRPAALVPAGRRRGRVNTPTPDTSTR